MLLFKSTSFHASMYTGMTDRYGIPLLLLQLFLLAGLGLHLLHLDCVWLAAAHVQLMVAHAQLQDALVYAQSRCIKHKVLK